MHTDPRSTWVINAFSPVSKLKHILHICINIYTIYMYVHLFTHSASLCWYFTYASVYVHKNFSGMSLCSFVVYFIYVHVVLLVDAYAVLLWVMFHCIVYECVYVRILCLPLCCSLFYTLQLRWATVNLPLTFVFVTLAAFWMYAYTHIHIRPNPANIVPTLWSMLRTINFCIYTKHT